MAEIKASRPDKNVFHPGYLLLIPFLLSLTVGNAGFQNQVQGKKKIDLRHADVDNIERDKFTGKDWHRLIGNVFLVHNAITMLCDSAHYYPDKNQVYAFNNIHIEQGDTLHIHGNYLFYDGTTEHAIMSENVELIDKETHLFTNSVNYDVRNEIAQYNDSGRIINGQNTLTSHIGIYDVPKSMFHFKDSVKIVNPDYVMRGDTMDYNTETETAFFTGPSEMKGDSIYLYCEKGWYDTKNSITRIWRNAVIDNKSQLIKGDSLYYDENTGFGQSFGNVSITDTSNSIVVKGEYAWYYRMPEKFLVTDSAMFIQISGNDSLFLHADTISAITLADSAGKEYRLMRAYFGCRVFSKDLQAKCDSLAYSFSDSVIRLFRSPVLWSAENQLTSDTMTIYTKNRQADRMELYYSAFVTSEVDTLRYDQIKGRKLVGYFKDNELYKISIDGNGESIYYLEDGDKVVGRNSSKCASIEILISKGKIQQIYERQSPEGVIDPPSRSPAANNKLEGFSWQDAIRPKKVSDIFRK
jgi:lipopolysaccharide export system protein LptA